MDGLAASREAPFVARREELGLLTSVIARNHDDPDRPAGAVVVAEAGVGKTRLVREALHWAAEHDFATAWAIATRSAATTPFAALAHLVPDTRFDAHDDASSLYRALAAGIVARAGGQRLVLAVDDAHLLDEGSAALVLQLVLGGSVTVLATARRGEPAPDSITALWKEGWCRRVDLQRFSMAETGEFIRAMVGGDVASRAVERLADASGGNTLFAYELVSAALDTGSLRQVDGVWRWDGRVPLTPRLVDAVGQRLDGLSAAERTVLGLLAIADPLALSVVERLTDAHHLSRLEAVRLVRVVQEDSGAAACRLVHPLYGEVVLDQLGAFECRRLMRTVADALAAEPVVGPDDAMRIANWRLDGGGDVTAGALLEAARTANRAFDHTLAERLAGASIARGAGPEARVALARALNGQNRFAEAEARVAAHEAMVLDGSGSLLREYMEVRFTALFHGLSRPDEATAMLDRVAGAGADTSTQHLVAGYRTHVLVDAGRLLETLEVADTVLSEPAADDTSVLLCAATKAEALVEMGRTRSAREVHARLRELASRGVPESSRAGMFATLQELQCQFFDGRASDVVARLEMYEAALARSRDDAQHGLVSMALGSAYLLRGSPVSACQSLHEAIAALSSSDFGGVRAWTLALLAQAEALRGAIPAAHRARQASRTFDLQGRTSRYDADFVTADALLAAAEGDLTRATEHALVGADRAGELLVRRARLLHLALRLGAPPSTVVRPLAEVAGRVESPVAQMYHHHAAALAANDAAGLEALAERFESLGLWLLAAEIFAQASAAHARTSVPSGATRAAARSAALAARCEGAHTPALAIASPLEPLSRRERDVARLAATGLSNRAIADRLSLSVRTVESHLYLAFAKLGVARREELARVITPLGDVPVPTNSQ